MSKRTLEQEEETSSPQMNKTAKKSKYHSLIEEYEELKHPKTIRSLTDVIDDWEKTFTVTGVRKIPTRYGTTNVFRITWEKQTHEVWAIKDLDILLLSTGIAKGLEEESLKIVMKIKGVTNKHVDCRIVKIEDSD